MKTKIFLLYIVAFLVLWACVPSNGTDDEQTIYIPTENGEDITIGDIAILKTADIEYPYIFQHISGRRIAIRDADGNGIYDGYLQKDGNYSELVTFNETTLLPEQKITSNGKLMLFSFKRETTLMDIVIKDEGKTSYARNIPISKADGLGGKKRGVLANKSDDLTNIRQAADAIALGISYASCAASLIEIGGVVLISGGTLTIPASFVAGIACSSFAASLASTIIKATNEELLEGVSDLLEGYDTIVDAGGCFLGDKADCIEFILGLVSNSTVELETKRKFLEELRESQEELIKVLKESANLHIIGDLNFREAEVGRRTKESVTLYNSGDEPMVITAIDINNAQDALSVEGETTFTLDPHSNKDVTIVFNPKTVKSYNTFLIIKNNRYQPVDVKTISAQGIEGSGAKIKLAGTLSYEEVTIGSSLSNFFDIENLSLNDTINVSTIDFVGVPMERFNILGWSSGAIVPGAKQEVEVVFTPIDETPYSGLIRVVNDMDNINNTISINGVGKKNSIKLVGNLNFGELTAGETKALTFDIENPNLNDDILISNIVLPDGYTADWSSGTIQPFAKKTVTITFSPQEGKEYPPVAVVEVQNNIDNENNTLSIFSQVILNQDILEGNWIASWQVSTCNASPTSTDINCDNHQNSRPYIFNQNNTGSCAQLYCGSMDFQNIKNGNTDSELFNTWEFDGVNLIMKIESQSSSGFFFDDRDFYYTAVFNSTTNTFTGTYETEYYGGLWNSKATGILTLTKE